MVVEKEGQVVGMFGERDFVLKVGLCGLSPRTTTIGQVMSEDIYCVTPGTSVNEAMVSLATLLR